MVQVKEIYKIDRITKISYKSLSASCTSSKSFSSNLFSKESSPALLFSNTLVSMLHNLELHCSINLLKDFLDGEVDQTLFDKLFWKNQGIQCII